MTNPENIWSTIWSQVIDLDGLTYHIAVPVVFALIALVAIAMGRLLALSVERLGEAEAPSPSQ